MARAVRAHQYHRYLLLPYYSSRAATHQGAKCVTRAAMEIAESCKTTSIEKIIIARAGRALKLCDISSGVPELLARGGPIFSWRMSSFSSESEYLILFCSWKNGGGPGCGITVGNDVA